MIKDVIMRENHPNWGRGIARQFMTKSVIEDNLVAVKTLARYLEIIVDPTFDDFAGNRGSESSWLSITLSNVSLTWCDP
jgi:hypothetical protein